MSDKIILNEGNDLSHEGEYDCFRNRLAILALRDKELKASYNNLPEVSDTELESWIQVVDPTGKIWKRYANKPIKGSDMKQPDMDGYAKEISPSIYQFYKLSIIKKRKEGEGLEDVQQAEPQAVYAESKNLNEDLSSMLTEESDDSVEQADPVAMFQDFSDVTGSLADIYSTLVNYQTSYVQNPKVQQSVTSLMSGVQQLLKQATQTMAMIGSSFGINEAKQLKEVTDDEMARWTPEQWSKWEAMHPLDRAKILMKQTQAPRGMGKFTKALETWAKSNVTNYKLVAKTDIGKRQIVRKFLETISPYQSANDADKKQMVTELASFWKI